MVLRGPQGIIKLVIKEVMPYRCIGCGVCYAACDTVTWRPDYLGPAALNRVWTLVNDERDGDRHGHLKKIAGEDGCLSCHSHQSCAELCPKHLNPTASIGGLKRKSFLLALTNRDGAGRP